MKRCWCLKTFYAYFFQLQQQHSQQAIGLQAMQAQQPLVSTVYIFHIYIDVSLHYKQKISILGSGYEIALHCDTFLEWI